MSSFVHTVVMNSSGGNSRPSFDGLIAQARAGDATALGEALQQCRGYLLAIANARLDDLLQPKLGGSDLVQQTLMHAHRDFAGFRGRGEGEMLAWLQRILLNEIARAKRDYLETAKRDVSREVSFGFQNGSHTGGSWLPANLETPSKQAAAKEDDSRLRAAIGQLGTTYRRVIEMRNRDLMTFRQIGEQMSISEERARRIWVRAIERLRNDLATEAENS